MNGTLRNLSPAEVEILEARHCHCSDWSQVRVSGDFTTQNVYNVVFRGKITIGRNGTPVIDADGMQRTSGIYNAELIDCTLGDDVYISKIGCYIANYDIADNACIENVGKLICTGTTKFGNGVAVRPVNEAGGREVLLRTGLTAQAAYMEALYRHRPRLTARLREMTAQYCEGIDGSRGRIGRGVRLIGTNTVRDVCIGDHAEIRGALILTNGTIVSDRQSPARIGAGVTAHEFICSRGSVVDNCASLYRCFIGEACRIDFGYTVTDSLFFSNSEGYNGEACSIFAGPYTVSHHKSSLLIAGYFLFFNAGSGANQSNHLFKTGAVHQGIHERGCKFGSNAYIMLPAREGAFSVVLGRHSSHHDTSDFPYSYLIEEETKSYLIPAINLRSYGTLRDNMKWRERDRRPANSSDIINFEQYNPYIGTKLLRAIGLSRKMLDKHGTEVHNYNRIRIKTLMLKRGLQLYQLALEATIGSILTAGTDSGEPADSRWVDLAGMYVPYNSLEQIVGDIESGQIVSYDQLSARLTLEHEKYRAHAYSWALLTLGNIIGHEPSAEEVSSAISKGKEAAAALKNMQSEDALRDDEANMRVGYGIDSIASQEKESDFDNVRKK